MKRIALSICLVLALFAAKAEDTVFYWKGSCTEWESWGDLMKWSTAKGSVANPTAAPGVGESDYLWPFGTCVKGDLNNYIGKFDLGGGAYALRGYSAGEGAGTAWKRYQLHLKNGKLSISNALQPPVSGSSRQTSIAYYLTSGATLNYNLPDDAQQGRMVGVSQLPECFDLADGSTAVLSGFLNVYGLKVSIAAGAKMTVNGGKISISSSANYNEAKGVQSNHIQFDNSGVLEFPDGFNWAFVTTDQAGGAELNRRMFVNQKSGELILGDAFQKTEESTNRQLLKFSLSGGKVTVPTGKTAGFYNVTTQHGQETFAEVAEGANVGFEVQEGASLDAKLFTYGSGSAVTKSGSGRLIVSEVPPSLSVEAGEVEFDQSLVDDANLSFANGSTVVFGALNNTISTISNYENLSFVLSASCPKPGVLLSGCDPTFAAAVAAQLIAPTGFRVCCEGGSVFIQAPVTVTACDFSVPTDSAAAGCGFKVSGLLDGDSADKVFRNEPTYDFGGYVEGSAPGTYTVSIAGLESEKYYVTSYASGTLWAFPPSEASDFYWVGGRTAEFSDYTDLSNWKMDSDKTVAATRLPCSADKLALLSLSGSGDYREYAAMDMKGGKYALGGIVTGSAGDYKSYYINVTNGTLAILDATRPANGIGLSHRVSGGGRLNLYAAGIADEGVKIFAGPNNPPSRLVVQAGGVTTIYNAMSLLAYTADILHGGRLVVDNGEFMVQNTASAKFQRYFNNEGTLEFPNGFNWAVDDYSNAGDFTKSVYVNQKAGEIRFGGDFKKDGTEKDSIRRGFFFSFSGGKLITESNKTVRFVQHLGTKQGLPEVFATVSNDCAVAVETLPGSILDMKIFEYKMGSSVTKLGAGRLELKDLPPMLSVVDGMVVFTEALTESANLALSDGVTVSFGATDNRLSSLGNAANVCFTLEADVFRKDDVILESQDSALLQTVKDRFVLPPTLQERYFVDVQGNKLFLLKKPRGIVLIVR